MELQSEKLLKEKGIEYKLIKLSEKAYTVEDVMKYSGGVVVPEEVCKTVILKGRKSGERVAVFLIGNDKINFSAIKKLAGEEVKMADSNDVKETAGVEPGAVCPFLLNISLFVDSKVMELKNINCGSGDHLFGVEFNPSDLSKMVDYKIADVSK